MKRVQIFNLFVIILIALNISLTIPLKADQSQNYKTDQLTTADECTHEGDNVAIFGGYKIEFSGPTNNSDGTSTWTYTVSGLGTAKHDLSHWVLGLCESHKVSNSTFVDWEVIEDPTTGVYGIKSDKGIDKNDGKATYEFTLEKQYDVQLVDVAIKAGQDNFYCTISGPVCDAGGSSDGTQASLGNLVWLDYSVAGAETNCNGIQDDDEPGIPGVKVYLLDSEGNNLDNTTTDENGNYLFSFTNVYNYSDDDCGECDGKVTKLKLRYDGNKEAKIEVYRKKGKNLSSLFEEDIESGGEFEFEGNDNKNTVGTSISIYVDGEENTTIHTSCSVPIGPGLVSGDFTVVSGESRNGGPLCSVEDDPGIVDKCFKIVVDESTLPDGYTPTLTEVGDDKTIDSNPNPTEVCFNPDDNFDMDADFGYCKEEEPCKSSVGNLIWHDSNVNGIQDEGETGIADVQVELHPSSGTVQKVSTDEDGNYVFENLPAGNYTVKIADSNFEEGGVFFDTPDLNWYPTLRNQKRDESVDSDGSLDNHEADFELFCNDNLDVDFGFFKTGVKLTKTGPAEVNSGDVITYSFKVENIGDLVLHGGCSVYDAKINDRGNHSIWSQVMEPGEVQNFEKTYTTSQDDDCGNLVNNAKAVGHPQMPDGKYKADVQSNSTWTVNVVCEEKGSLGNFVWVDEDLDGIQDENEKGFEGMDVVLYDCNGNWVANTDKSDEDGNYVFNDLKAGSYVVKFYSPTGYSFSPQYSGDNKDIDSDADITTGESGCVEVKAGKFNQTVDVGIYKSRASVGDYIWIDENENGLQDVTESGLKNVKITLFDCSGTQIDETESDNSGFYEFTKIEPGEYYVHFSISDDYVFTSKDQELTGDNQPLSDRFDSDVNPASGKTDCFTLESGDINYTIDAGVYAPAPPQGNADLSLEKTVDNDSPNNDDVIKYTLTVTNNGSLKAENVEVLDKLPKGVNFQSSSASQGNYEVESGKWEVGTLENGANATLDISVKVNIQEAASVSLDLGPAKDFNVFVLGNINQPSSDTEGRMAIGNDAYFNEYSHGDKLTPANPPEDVLIVGHNLEYIGGRVYNGNVVYGNHTNLPQILVGIEEGVLRKDSPIDFEAAGAELKNLSSTLGSRPANGETVYNFTALRLTGTDPLLNVFAVSGEDLTSSTECFINSPNGSVVVVNVTGTDIDWVGRLYINGTNNANVLYNFPDAENLTIHNIDILGSILAPFAHVKFTTGVQNGQMVAGSLEGQGQFNNVKFVGNIPTEACVVNSAEISNSSLPDPDSEPGNGIAGEDDIATATFCLDFESNTDGGSQDGGSEWKYEGEVGNGELIWSLSNDASSDVYSGTWGGKVYQYSTSDKEWVLINEEMEADFIWSLNYYNGNVFAGTEKGIFRYDGESWLLLSGLDADVRSIAHDEHGNLFAAAWGKGVYKSPNEGTTWVEVNDGITGQLAMHACAINSNGDVYVGSMNGGVHSTLNSGTNWQPLNIGYEYIWSINIDSQDRVFVGTYGGGLYLSTDKGASWKHASLPANYIYAISFDDKDNVYISSWEAGVFVSKDNGSTWKSLGMGGLGISSMLINQEDDGGGIAVNNKNHTSAASNRIYAGTSDGKMYSKYTDKITGVKKVEIIPTEFELKQNYPNPFNPSTKIEFSIPKAGNFKLEIFNILGQKVKTLVNGNLGTGIHFATFNARQFASGVFIYRLTGNGVNITKKMMLLK